LNQVFANRSEDDEIYPLTVTEIAEAQKADAELIGGQPQEASHPNEQGPARGGRAEPRRHQEEGGTEAGVPQRPARRSA
jgi:hypothetical protein